MTLVHYRKRSVCPGGLEKGDTDAVVATSQDHGWVMVVATPQDHGWVMVVATLLAEWHAALGPGTDAGPI